MKVADVLSLVKPDENIALTFNVCGKPFKSVFTAQSVLDSDNSSLRDSEVWFVRIISTGNSSVPMICFDLKGDFEISPFVVPSRVPSDLKF